MGCKPVLVSYEVSSITQGADALGKVIVRIAGNPNDSSTSNESIEAESYQPFDNQNLCQGQGTDEDILIASAKAYLQALNRLLKTSQRGHDECVSRQVQV